MSQENVEMEALAHVAFDALNRGDLDDYLSWSIRKPNLRR